MSDEALIVVMHDCIAVAVDVTRDKKERDAALLFAWNLLKQLPIQAIKESLIPSKGS